MGGVFSYVFEEPGDYYLRSTSATSMRLQVHVYDCQFCHVLSGYSGANAASLAIALSSETAGEYEYRLPSPPATERPNHPTPPSVVIKAP